MTRRPLLATLVLGAPALLLAATYYLTDPLTSISTANWTVNGGVTATSGGLTGSSAGGSLISKVAVPGGNAAQEVRTTYRLAVSGGSYVTYLKASADAFLGTTSTGTFYAVELANPTVSGGSCSATLTLRKRAAGTLTQLATSAIGCRDGMAVRSAIRADGAITVTHDGGSLVATDTAIASGQPGVGARSTPAGNAVSLVELGPGDAVAPSAVPTPAVTSFGTRVEMQWGGVTDDAAGSGLWLYQVYRGSTLVGSTPTPAFTDDAVGAMNTYSYTIKAVDYHRNVSAGTTFSVRTPGTTTRNPRRTGVRPTGSYWGAMGESLDLQSGNLHFALPLLSAQGRGWSVPFALAYNSQTWRQDPAGIWRLGRDVGYGHGWTLTPGSIAPSWEDAYTVHHYTYTDASGAESRLDVNTDGVWTSREGVFVSYDEETRHLTFPSGMVWAMGAESAGTEEDAGTLYPTLIRDANGNQVFVRYMTGNLATTPNTSARITGIEDVRAVCQSTANGCSYVTYGFEYDTGPFNPNPKPHLIGVSSEISTGENYDLAFQSVTSLVSPFGGSATFGAAQLLQTVTQRSTSLAHTFTYQPGAELGQVTFPYGGTLGWTHRSFTYTDSRTLREVSQRTLRPTPGAALLTYGLTHDDAADAARSAHSWTVLSDPSGTADQKWSFQPASSTFDAALVTQHERRALPGPTVKSRQAYTWAQTPNGNPYIASTTTTMDPGASFQSQSKQDQTVDDWGNVTQTKLYHLNSLTTPARTYNYGYLAGADYASRGIRNRVSSATVTDGTTTVTLSTNTYDNYAAAGGCAARTLAGRTGVRQHDTVAYGTGLAFRGNLAIGQSPGRTTCYTRDILGAVTRAGDIDGHWRDLEYSSSSNYAVPTAITPNGTTALRTANSYNAFLGVTDATGPNGATSTFTYTAEARPATATSAQGAQTTFAYQDGVRQRTATTNGRAVRTTTDGLGRTIKVERIDTGGTVRSVVDTEYSACACSPLGKVKRVSQPHLPGASTIHWTTYTYDALGRTVSVALPGGTGTTSTLYEGNTVKVTTAAGRWKKHATDAFGNLVRVTEPNPAGGADLLTDQAYSLLDQLRTVTMTRNAVTQTRTFTYDPATQRLASVTLPENGTTAYAYNRDGSLLRRTDAKNQKVEHTYDTLGRLTVVRRFAAGAGTDDACQRVTYTYDTNPLDGTYTLNAQGRLTTAQHGGSACAAKAWAEMLSYTPSGLVTKRRLRHTRGALSASLDASWAHDNEGRVTAMEYPDAYQPGNPSALVVGGSFTHAYDALGRPSGLTEMQDRSVTHARNVGYGPADELTALQTLNQKGATAAADTYLSETRVYNARLQATRMTVPGVADLERRYSATQNDGLLASRKDHVTGEDVTYLYDGLQRLLSATTTHTGGTVAPWGLSFAYDGFGNKTGQAVTQGAGPHLSLSVDAATNRVTGAGIGYDANGNTTLHNGVALGYDVDNRLVSYGASERYAYAPSGQRVWRKKADGTEEVYFHGAGGERLGTYRVSEAGGVLKFLELHKSVHFAGRTVRAEGAAHVTDPVGSDLTAGKRYYPYGEQLTGTAASDETAFATYHRDSTTGLDYAEQRYFASQWGRFLTPDPSAQSMGAANPQGWNRYAYVENDPVNHNDPSGLLTVIVTGTGEQDPPWAAPGGDMRAAIQGHFGETDACTAHYSWPGSWFDTIWGQPMIDAASGLNEQIGRLSNQGCAGQPLNLVGYSHGGNVIKEYTNQPYAQPVANLVTLGTPNRPDFIVNLDRSRVQNYCTVSYENDAVQFGGAHPTQLYFYGSLLRASYQASSAGVQAALYGDPWLASRYFAEGAGLTLAAGAVEFFTRYDAAADVNAVLDGGFLWSRDRHTDVRSVPAWQQVTSSPGFFCR